jgi:hypothetical protein
VLPSLKIPPQNAADGLAEVIDRHNSNADVEVSVVPPSKEDFFQLLFLCTRDDQMHLAFPLWYPAFGSGMCLESSYNNERWQVQPVERPA